jgi:hypothetical protein
MSAHSPNCNPQPNDLRSQPEARPSVEAERYHQGITADSFYSLPAPSNDNAALGALFESALG